MKLIEGLYIFVLVTCFAGSCACVSGGTSVLDIVPYNYQVAVLCPIIMCSGAIVSVRNVLTTAICINTLSPDDVEIYAGSSQYYTNGSSFDVVDILQHPQFNRANYDNNIAILTIQGQFPFSRSQGRIGSIPLATVLPTGSSALATAYGAQDKYSNLPPYLKMASLTTYTMAACQNYKNNRLTTTMFCAADQGAPLTYNGKLVGIYSWGCSCGLAAPYTSSPVFNSIPLFSSWIKSSIALLNTE